MEERRAVSRRLYRVLEEVGASEELRQLHRETTAAREIFYTVTETLGFSTLINTYNCGSSFEGTMTPDLASDRDVVACTNAFPVVHDIHDAPPGESLLMVRDSYTYPGYVKLQMLEDGQPLTAQHGYPIQRMNCELDLNGRVCLNKAPLLTGPASQSINEAGEHYLDFVPAHRCATIPPFAIQWFQQQRLSGRSSEERMHAMSRMGCMFVGAGHVNSPEKCIEWRMSFSLQERLLMTELNPVQHKTYILLKMIKKNILAKVFNDETLTSYHFKTCVLSAVQMTPAGNWTEDNLINCILQCLKLMIYWLKQNKCPNFFVNDQNYFVKAGFSHSLTRRLLQVIRLILNNFTQCLYLIQSDNVGEMLRHWDCRRYRELSVMNTNQFTANLILRSTGEFMVGIRRVLTTLENTNQTLISLASTLNILQRTESINHHSIEVTQASLAYLYPWLHLYTAKALVSLVYSYPDTENKQQLLEMADFHFNEARDADLVNERLARATILFKAEQFDECFLLLQQVESDFTFHVTRKCSCVYKTATNYFDEQDEQNQVRKIANMPLRQFTKTLTAYCVVFLPSALEITPLPLQYEMRRSHGTLPDSRIEYFHYWFDWAVVDPMVYLYFMQYLVSTRLNKELHKQNALDNLRAVILKDYGTQLMQGLSHMGHRDTACNLLGWIYAQEGRPIEALIYFSESWRIRPYHNAAKFHFRDLLVNLLQRRE